MKVNDIDLVVKKFQETTDANDRYTSFDYCYNYFKRRDFEDIEKSCLTLGFYLASWGMFRGSSFLLQKSAKYFQPTVEYITKLDESVWDIDVDKYTDSNIKMITEIYKDIKGLIIENGNSDLTLVTKILMGIFGFIPAYDQYFCNCFRDMFQGECGFRRLNEKSLKLINVFYSENKETIDTLASQTFTTDFLTGSKTNISYPKAKIVDMYGFTKGLNK